MLPWSPAGLRNRQIPFVGYACSSEPCRTGSKSYPKPHTNPTLGKINKRFTPTSRPQKTPELRPAVSSIAWSLPLVLCSPPRLPKSAPARKKPSASYLLSTHAVQSALIGSSHGPHRRRAVHYGLVKGEKDRRAKGSGGHEPPVALPSFKPGQRPNCRRTHLLPGRRPRSRSMPANRLDQPHQCPR